MTCDGLIKSEKRKKETERNLNTSQEASTRDKFMAFITHKCERYCS